VADSWKQKEKEEEADMPLTTTFTLADLTRMLRESAGEEEGVDLDSDVEDTPFTELGYDSLALLEIIGKIQREYGVTITDDAAAYAETPGALLELVNNAR
jgi:act minimal PKS acyl carrier protein